MPLRTGDLLDHGKYRVLNLIGEGGFGYVYHAEDILLRRSVAIKELIPAPGHEAVLKRFLAEARATLELTHVRIVRTYTLFQEGGTGPDTRHYIVMEYMPGGSLEQRLQRRGALPAGEAVAIAAQVCEALEYAHAAGVVHCDLKPGNILFDAQGGAKVADFGIAHVSEQMLTRTWHTAAGFMAGTLPYMSPEQVAGVRDDARLDVYALGAVLYRMLTGRAYLDFEHRDTPLAQAENVLRIRSEEPQAPSRHTAAIPGWLDGIVLQTLAKEPGQRPASAAALRQALVQGPAAAAPTVVKAAPYPEAAARHGPAAEQTLPRMPAAGPPAQPPYGSPPQTPSARPEAGLTPQRPTPQPGRAERPVSRQVKAVTPAQPPGTATAKARAVPGWLWPVAGVAAAAIVILGLVFGLAGGRDRATAEPTAAWTKAPQAQEPTPRQTFVTAVTPVPPPASPAREEPTEAPPPEPAREEPTEAPEPEPAPPSGPYAGIDPAGQRVMYWHQYTRDRQEGLNQMVEEFNASNEWGITVIAEYAGGYGEIYDKMTAVIAAGDRASMPNLVAGYANHLATYQLSEALVDLDDLVESPSWGLTAGERADFFPGIFESDVSPILGDGHFRLAFPPNRSMEVLYYNLDWLHDLGYDGPPTTWGEFEAMACEATDPDLGTIGYEISTDASRFASMVFSRHGSYFLEDGRSFDFENGVVVETMLFIKNLYDMGCARLIAEPYGDQTDFGNYKTLFTIGSSSGMPYYDQAVKGGEEGPFAWGVAPLPFLAGGDVPVMNTYGASIAIPRTTPEQELAAWLFLKRFTSPENNARWAQISGYLPVRESTAIYLGDYFAQNRKYKDAFDLLQFGTYEAQWCPCYEEVRDHMGAAYARILDGADIEPTLAELQEIANGSLRDLGVIP